MEGIPDAPCQMVISETDTELTIFMCKIDNPFKGRAALFFADNILDEVQDLILMQA